MRAADELARDRDGHAGPLALVPQRRARVRRNLVGERERGAEAERAVAPRRPLRQRHRNLRGAGVEPLEAKRAAVALEPKPEQAAEGAVPRGDEPEVLGDAAEARADRHRVATLALPLRTPRSRLRRAVACDAPSLRRPNLLIFTPATRARARAV